jgi:hypothetical protein
MAPGRNAGARVDFRPLIKRGRGPRVHLGLLSNGCTSGRAVVMEERCKKRAPAEDPASLSKGKEKKQNKGRIRRERAAKMR